MVYNSLLKGMKGACGGVGPLLLGGEVRKGSVGRKERIASREIWAILGLSIQATI